MQWHAGRVDDGARTVLLLQLIAGVGQAEGPAADVPDGGVELLDRRVDRDRRPPRVVREDVERWGQL